MSISLVVIGVFQFFTASIYSSPIANTVCLLFGQEIPLLSGIEGILLLSALIHIAEIYQRLVLFVGWSDDHPLNVPLQGCRQERLTQCSKSVHARLGS